MQKNEVPSLERELRSLRHTLWAFDAAMDRYFAGDFDESERKTWEHRLKSLRVVLLKLANDVVDQFGPPEDPTLPDGMSEFELARLRDRVSILWDVHSGALEKYGVIKTEDGKAFTFAKVASEGENAG